MYIYEVMDSNNFRYRGYCSTLDRAKEKLWELYKDDSGWYEEDDPQERMRHWETLNEDWYIRGIGYINEIEVED